MSLTDFIQMFPTDDACLEYVKQRLYPAGRPCPRCGRPSKFHRITGRSAYSCQFCGVHVYPTAGTIFHRSSTPLQLWFWATFLISSTHGRITLRELSLEIGVSHKTAQRMAERIADLLGYAPGEEEKPARQSIWNAQRRVA